MVVCTAMALARRQWMSGGTECAGQPEPMHHATLAQVWPCTYFPHCQFDDGAVVHRHFRYLLELQTKG